VHHYHKSYGVGILIDSDGAWYEDERRHWAIFNNERIMVRLDELKVISENR